MATQTTLVVLLLVLVGFIVILEYFSQEKSLLDKVAASNDVDMTLLQEAIEYLNKDEGCWNTTMFSCHSLIFLAKIDPVKAQKETIKMYKFRKEIKERAQ